MTGLYARIQVEALRLRGAVRQYWKRLAIGAFLGWLTSTVLGAIVLVWLESRDLIASDETAAFFAAVIVWSGTAIGALVAYASRPDREATTP